MLFRETLAVYWENHTEHTNTLCEQNSKFFMLKHVVYIVTTVLYGVKLYWIMLWEVTSRYCERQVNLIRRRILQTCSIVQSV
jgi:hypothetical protein